MSVFITGASSGIGEACARAFAAAKQNLVLAARRKDRLESLRDELVKAHSVKVEVVELDIRDHAAIDELFRARRDVLSEVDVLINNAGLARGREPIQEGKPEDWDVVIDTNLKGLLYMTRAFLPQMMARKDGHVVNLGSAAGHWTYPAGNVYSATKFAVRAITESLRMDLNGSGIRVTEVSPGMVETDFSRVRFDGDEKKAKAIYEGMTPLTAKDIAEAVLWSVQRPKHVNIQEIILFPTDQAGVGMVHRR
jgi:3-hydroxy acid dehydrogenase/malonic semialdehyde reductase